MTSHWNKDRVRFDYSVNGQMDELLTDLGEARQANATDLILDEIGGRGGELVDIVLLNDTRRTGEKEWTFFFKHALTQEEWFELKTKQREKRKGEGG